jgi:hypothetical protein
MRKCRVQVEVNRTFVSDWPDIGQRVLPLPQCRRNCSHRGVCMLWTGAPPEKGPQSPRCECYYGYRSRAIGPAGDFLVSVASSQLIFLAHLIVALLCSSLITTMRSTRACKAASTCCSSQ